MVCNYRLKAPLIRSNCKFENGFQIAKLINVDSINSEGRPIKFEHDTIVFCGTQGDRYISEQEQEVYKEQNIPIKKYGFKFKAKNKIFFDKENKYYKWWFFKPYNPSEIHDTLPIQFLKGKWYRFYNLSSGDGCPNFEIFIKVGDNEQFEVIEFYDQGPF